jgi:hypothetical protein
MAIFICHRHKPMDQCYINFPDSYARVSYTRIMDFVRPELIGVISF